MKDADIRILLPALSQCSQLVEVNFVEKLSISVQPEDAAAHCQTETSGTEGIPCS